jgi:adenylate kinase family enzyme
MSDAMKRIVILGCAGAGKSTLATRISRRIGAPAVHLDALFYRRGWTLAPRHDALGELDAALARDSWILDGNFLSAGEERFRRAQHVVFLDRSRATCFWRVLRRRLLAVFGRTRTDLPEGCVEVLDIKLLKWIWRYPRIERPLVFELLGRFENEVTVHHLRSDDDVDRFLTALAPGGRDR